MSFMAYLKSRQASDKAIATATIWTPAMLGQEPEDVSALYFLNYCKSGGGLLQMRSDRRHGGQYLRIAKERSPSRRPSRPPFQKALCSCHRQ